MDGFEIKPLPGKGRSMIALKTFQEGDTIFEEEPFVSCQFTWNAIYGYKACDHCIRPLETAEENVRRLANDASIILPFPNCCPTKNWIRNFTDCPKCGVHYCSKECQFAAFKRYHRTACMAESKDDASHPINILNETWRNIHFPPESATIKLVIRLLAMYKQNQYKEDFLETLQSFQSITVNEEDKIYHKILGSNFKTQMEQLYESFRNAYPEDEYAMFTTPDGFKSLIALVGTNSQGLATSALDEWVKKVGELEVSDKTRDEVEQYLDGLYIKVTAFAGEFLNNEASGLYMLQSKINHSCVPNAQSSFPYSNDILVLKAVKTIEIGEEICTSYLNDCQLEQSRHSRHKELKENFLFICTCPKCQEQAGDPDVTSASEESENDVEMENN